MLLTFQSKPVPILWSPRKGTNAAWRVGSETGQVLEFKRSDPLENMRKNLQKKYGSDFYYDMTDVEYHEFKALERRQREA